MQLVLRLLCLASIVNGGIKSKSLENIKREILQVGLSSLDIDSRLIVLPTKSYGYEYMPLLIALSTSPLSLLLPNPLPAAAASLASSKIPYTAIRKSLRLVNDEPDDLDDPGDISYVYSGYAPLSVRLVQCVVQKGSVLNASGMNGEGADAARRRKDASGMGKVRAHPIVGWKGFEDVVDSIPGETIDIVQKGVNSSESHATSATTGKEFLPSASLP